jgi:predicted RNA-binding Zn-ribbon protein involved in translation (DUF1610 family)
MTALHVCVKCHSGSWSIEREDQSVTALCIVCGTRVLIRDGRAEARDAEVAAVRGHQKHGPKPKGAGHE